MRTVDVVELLGEVLPRRWVQAVVRLLVVFMLLTGITAPLMWFINAKAASIQDDLAPALQHIVQMATSTVLPTAAVK